MKKVFIAICITIMSMNLMAEETGHHNSHSGLYVISKALVTTSVKVDHEGNTLESGIGRGLGFDLGYKITNSLAIEADFSYDQNEIEENNDGIKIDAKYYTYAVDVAYTKHLNHSISFMAKLGYELEDEQIHELHISQFNQGFIYGLGLEYVLHDQHELVVEYEHSTIESTRGQSIFLGVKHSF